MIWQPGKALELMGGGQVQAGTMLDGVSLHLLLRAGNMRPFFSRYIDQFASARGKGRRLQYYFFIKPAVQWWTYNALIQGGSSAGKAAIMQASTARGKALP